MAAESHDRYLARSYFSGLDGLRCLSILPVIWHHATPYPMEGALGRGPLGVDLFFAISGFLITTLLAREQRATQTVSLRAFFARRAIRIFPLYYVVLAGYVLYALLFTYGPMRSHFFRSLPFFATYTTNWLVDWSVPHPVLFAFSWSLATEEQFYLVWPTAMTLLRRRALAVVVMFAFIVLDQLTERGALPLTGRAYRVVTSFATPIGLGSLAALALDEPKVFRVFERATRERWTLGLIWLGVAAAFAVGIPLFLAHALFAVLVASVAVTGSAILEARPIRYVGRVSYGMYLLHGLAIGLVRRAFPAAVPNAFIVFALAAPLTVLFASVTYAVVEKPLLGLRSRFRRPTAT